jgi:hypothetical protein
MASRKELKVQWKGGWGNRVDVILVKGQWIVWSWLTRSKDKESGLKDEGEDREMRRALRKIILTNLGRDRCRDGNSEEGLPV